MISVQLLWLTASLELLRAAGCSGQSAMMMAGFLSPGPLEPLRAAAWVALPGGCVTWRRSVDFCYLMYRKETGFWDVPVCP